MTSRELSELVSTRELIGHSPTTVVNGELLTLETLTKGNEFSNGGAGARSNHHAPTHTTATDPAVANARAGPYHLMKWEHFSSRRLRYFIPSCVHYPPERGNYLKKRSGELPAVFRSAWVVGAHCF